MVNLWIGCPGEKAGKWQEAMQVLEWLLSSFMEPNVVTFTCALRACAGHGSVKALTLLQTMTAWQADDQNHSPFNSTTLLALLLFQKWTVLLAYLHILIASFAAILQDDCPAFLSG